MLCHLIEVAPHGGSRETVIEQLRTIGPQWSYALEIIRHHFVLELIELQRRPIFVLLPSDILAMYSS